MTLTSAIDILGSAYPQWRKLSRPSRLAFTGNLISYRPLIGKKVNLKVSLDLLTSLRLETDAQTGIPKVVVGECLSDSDSISITLLDG